MKNKVGLFLCKMKEWFCRELFPEDIKCLFCENDVPDFENKPICDDCEKSLAFNNGNKCLICAEPIDNEAVVCDHCQKEKRFFKKAFCPFVYEGKVRKALLGFKDSNKRYLANGFAGFLAKEIVDSGVEIDFLTYIPMTDKKTKKRGFNQSKLLAEEVGKLLGLEVKTLFAKTEDRKTQKFSNFKERQDNIKGLYALGDVKLKKTDRVLIVDDIVTTCATVNYCAGLLEKKVREVYVGAVARNKLMGNKKVGN